MQQFDLPPVRARPAVAVPVSAVALADVPVWVTPELRSSCVVSSCACGEWRGCELRSRPVAVPSHSCDPSIDGPCCYGVHRRSHTRAQDADDGFRSYVPQSRLRRLIMPSLDLTARRCLSRGTIATPRRLGPSGGLSPPACRPSPAWRTLDLSAPPARESWRLLRPAACPLPDVHRSAGTPPRPGRGVAPAPAVVLRTDVRTLLPLQGSGGFAASWTYPGCLEGGGAAGRSGESGRWPVRWAGAWLQQLQRARQL